MSKYTNYQTKLAAAIEAAAELPEFTADVENGSGKVVEYGNVFVANGVKKPYGGSIEQHVKFVVSKNSGLALLFYGRSGKNTNTKSSTLVAEVRQTCELHIDPIKYLKQPGVRGLEEMEEAVASFIHGLILDNDTHCKQALQVHDWQEAYDKHRYVTQFTIVKPVMPVGT
tara:strand:+ start:287 stop:796 length:510 start_codon:yes stop_codon:yes gene_type:complete